MSENYWTTGSLFTVPIGASKGFYGSTPVDNQSPPSTYAVASVLEGEPGAFLRLAGVTAIRSVFIIPGIWIPAKLLGMEEIKGWKLVALGLSASVTISLGMLAWYALRKLGTNPQPTQTQPLPPVSEPINASPS